jgi:uncharacterized protein (DUF58 family)
MEKRKTSIHPTLVFVVLVSLVAPSAFFQGKNLPMWLFGVMLITMVVTFVWAKLVLRRINVRRIILEPAKVGEPYIVRYELTNTAKRIAGFSLWVEEQPSKHSTWQHFFRKARGWIMEVGAGETVHGEAIFWPTNRGEATFDHIRLTTSFPFGMLRSTKTISQHTTVLVQPKVEKLQPSILRAIVSSGPLGQRSNRRGRGGDDYYGLRELVSGDRIGDIAWKASAKRGELVCIQRARPSLPKMRVVLDLTTPTNELQCDGNPHDVEEQTISLCASILSEAIRQEQEIALTILGVQTPRIVGFHSGSRHLTRLLSTLARIQLANARTPIPIRPVADNHQVGLVVIRPDRSTPLRSMSNVWYFHAEQLEGLRLDTVRSDSA